MGTLKATPKMRYWAHKSKARARGIAFDLTFDEWWAIWQPYYHLRGTDPDSMQMCRLYDMGGYTSDNVRIMTGRENMREAVETRIMRANAKAWVIDGEDRRECREWVKDRYIWRDPMRQLMKAEAQSEDE